MLHVAAFVQLNGEWREIFNFWFDYQRNSFGLLVHTYFKFAEIQIKNFFSACYARMESIFLVKLYKYAIFFLVSVSLLIWVPDHSLAGVGADQKQSFLLNS